MLSIDGPYPVIGTGGTERHGNGFLHEGDSIILGRKGTIDRVQMVGGRFWPIDTVYYLTDFWDVSPHWLFYFLETIDLRKLNEATGVPSLSREMLYQIEISKPRKDEQRKIAEILSTVDRTIEQTKAVIAKQQRIKNGLMQDLLTKGIDGQGNIRSEQTHEFKDSPLGRIPADWEISTVGEKVDFITDYRGKTPPYTNSGTPVLSAESIGDGRVRAITRYVSEDTYRRWTTRGLPEEDDVVFTTEAPVGEVAPFPGDGTYLLTRRVIAIRPDVFSLRKRFLYWILVREKRIGYWEARTAGTTAPRIRKQDILNLEMRLPPPEEQDQITTILNTQDSLIFEYGREKTKLVNLKSALMQDLLTGKVRVTPLLDKEDGAG